MLLRMAKSIGKRVLPRTVIVGLHRAKVRLHDLADDALHFSPPVPDFPPMVMLDTTTRCNLACSHCPSSVLSQDKSWQGEMDTGLYCRLIDEVASVAPDTVVRPFNSGEPLLRKDMEELVSYAKKQGIRHVVFNTNGVLLSSRRARALLEAGLDGIEISIDAFSAGTFKKIKNLDLYDKVMENVGSLLTTRSELNPRFAVAVSFVKQRDNLHEVEAFRAHWTVRADSVGIREYHQHHGLVDGHGLLARRPAVRRYPCMYLWQRLIVQHTGEVRFCESDWKAEHSKIGDAREQTLKEIWHSAAMNEVRRSHVRRTFAHPYCRSCRDWMFMGRARAF